MMEASRQSVSTICAHPEIDYLGDNRGARFFYCESCGQVFVVQSGQTWSIPALRRRDADDAERG